MQEAGAEQREQKLGMIGGKQQKAMPQTEARKTHSPETLQENAPHNEMHAVWRKTKTGTSTAQQLDGTV